jgi:hypothetical protein
MDSDDKIHEECIYFIASAMMKAADDKIQQQRTTDTLRKSLRELLRLQKIIKDEAIEVNAPSGGVVRRIGNFDTQFRQRPRWREAGIFMMTTKIIGRRWMIGTLYHRLKDWVE